jgi:hypothetical protein
MKWQHFEVVAAAALRGRSEVLAPSDFRKPVHHFIRIQSAILIFEPTFSH